MSATTANNAEFQDGGKPVANPVYLVDANGNVTYGTQGNPVATNQVVGTPVYATTVLAVATGGNAALPAAAGKTTYINGFYVSVGHATTASTPNGQVTVSFDGGTTVHMNYLIAVSQTYPGLVQVDFPDPIPAKNPNQTIVVTCPTLANTGAGSITVFGYQI